MILLPSTYSLTPLGIDILPSEYTHLTGTINSLDFLLQVLKDYPSIKYIIHSATLHKPHIESHTTQDFIDTNITGTSNLLMAANTSGNIQSFVFVSTTSAFGDALASRPGEPANWIDETVRERPKNIYGVTKVAAENLCLLQHRANKMPIIVLRTSRFFPEEDDVRERREAYGDEALKVQELLYRRVDLADVVSACVCAVRRMAEGAVTWSVYIVSAPSPFDEDGRILRSLDKNVQLAVQAVCPESVEIFERKGWKWLDRIDRVYDSRKAMTELEWQPQVTFDTAIKYIKEEKDWRSDVVGKVGRRGYHSESTGIYTKR